MSGVTTLWLAYLSWCYTPFASVYCYLMLCLSCQPWREYLRWKFRFLSPAERFVGRDNWISVGLFMAGFLLPTTAAVQRLAIISAGSAPSSRLSIVLAAIVLIVYTNVKRVSTGVFQQDIDLEFTVTRGEDAAIPRKLNKTCAVSDRQLSRRDVGYKHLTVVFWSKTRWNLATTRLSLIVGTLVLIPGQVVGCIENATTSILKEVATRKSRFLANEKQE